MINYNLFSSVALFSELYNNNKSKDIYDILGDFVSGIINLEKKYTYTIDELSNSLIDNYGFNIPKAVVKSVLKNRLSDVCSFNGISYFFNKEKVKTFDYENKFDDFSDKFYSFLERLYEYINIKTNVEISDDIKDKINESLNYYLLDEKLDLDYSKFISFFIINKTNSEDILILNTIKEGLVLYQGITYTPNLNELGNWKNKITFYLNTELLFNSVGYNGEIYKEIFFDFYYLVKEINQKNKDKKIFLKYFPETKTEIENFFSTAEQIKKGKIRLEYDRPAMVSILNGTNNLSDIVAKKTIFFLNLKKLGIEIDEFEFDVIHNPEFNLYSESGKNAILEEVASKSKYIDENVLMSYISIYTKIGFLRKDNKRPLDKIGYLFLSENSIALYLGHNKNLKLSENDTPYAKSMDYFTTKFWFLLKKGFSDLSKPPATFDIISKAKIVLSSQVSNKVSEEYNKILTEFKVGKLGEEEAAVRYQSLKNIPILPENITSSKTDDALNFLVDENYTINLISELNKKNIEIEETKKELEKYKQKEFAFNEKRELEELNKKKATWANEQYCKERNEQISKIKYFIRTLIFEIIIVLVTVLIFRLKYVTDLLDKYTINETFTFWIVIITLLLISLFVKNYFVDKDKVKIGWMSIVNIRNLYTKKYKQERIKYFTSNYKTDN